MDPQSQFLFDLMTNTTPAFGFAFTCLWLLKIQRDDHIKRIEEDAARWVEQNKRYDQIVSQLIEHMAELRESSRSNGEALGRLAYEIRNIAERSDRASSIASRDVDRGGDRR